MRLSRALPNEISLSIRFEGKDGFFISNHEIIPTGEENIAGLTVLYNQTNSNPTIICDCKLDYCQYFSDTNTVYCLDANGKRIKSSAAIISLFLPLLLLRYLI